MEVYLLFHNGQLVFANRDLDAIKHWINNHPGGKHDVLSIILGREYSTRKVEL
jgi:hypothetical protein